MRGVVQDLRHEGKVYDILINVQGLAIRIGLGNMDLDRTYHLDIGVRIVHMLYVAWGGESPDHYTLSVLLANLEYE